MYPGLDERILKSLYTCIESEFIITPFNDFANSRANLDFPIPVGPEIIIKDSSTL